MAKNFKTEAIAGITTFFTMAYIIFVNPAILSTEGTGMSFSGVLTATVLLSFLMTLLMGLYAKLPFAVAPGMGINAFFTFTIILGQKVPWQTALGMIFWAGILFLLISLTPLRLKIATSIPLQLRLAAGAGIGIFLSFIGFKNAGLIVSDAQTLVKLGHLGMTSLISMAGLVIMVWLGRKKNPMAFLAGIFFVTIVSYFFGFIKTPSSFFAPPDFQSVFFKLDILGALKLSLLPAIISILFTDLFDSIATFMGVSHASGLLDEKGEPKNLKQGLIVDAFATFAAGLFGTSSGTAFIESSAGIEAGGKTGMTSVFTAICFLPFFFIAPLAGMIPAYATAPVMIFVGALMFKSVTHLKFETLEDLVPAFLTIILIPLTFSITQGILWGFVAHVLFYLLAGRRKEIAPMMYGLSILSVILLTIEHI